MRWSFMTWVAPEWTLSELIQGAKRYGYDGVEIRVEAKHAHGVELDMTQEDRKSVRRAFADAGVEISCVATSVRFMADYPDPCGEQAALAGLYAELASDLGCPVIRVFGGQLPAGLDSAAAKSFLVEGMSWAATRAADHAVTLCFETHDAWCHAADVREVIDAVNRPNLRILWDIAHPHRLGEDFETTCEAVTGRVAHCHFHDYAGVGTAEEAMVELGEGNVPHADAIAWLTSQGYDGFFSNEWMGEVQPDRVLPHDIALLKLWAQQA